LAVAQLDCRLVDVVVANDGNAPVTVHVILPEDVSCARLAAPAVVALLAALTDENALESFLSLAA
jgi:hypothetical protein